MKKLLIPIVVVIFVIGGGGLAFRYYNGPKITNATVSKNIASDGKPVDIASVFSPKDTIYFSAKGKKLLVKKARVVWYKDKIAKANRYKVQEDIAMSSSGYFSTSLSVPEGLEEGTYYVNIYADDSDVNETTGQFEIKK
jgi:uncharacterized protein YxeA